MANNQVQVISDLPKFSGSPRTGERREGVDLRSFLRALDNHFASNNIVADDRKLRVLYAHISSHTGDAHHVVSSYAGCIETYDDIKRQLLNYYPINASTDFNGASHLYFNSTLTEKNLRCDMSSLATRVRALTESYITKKTSVTGLTMDARVVKEDDTEVPLPNVLNNMLLQIITTLNMPSKVFEKLEVITPEQGPNEFTSQAVNAFDKYITKKKSRTPKPNNHEIIWKTESQPESNTAVQVQQSNNKQGPQTNNRKSGGQDKTKNCYRCDKLGHVAANCRVKIQCSNCKRTNHITKHCRLRNSCKKCGKAGHSSNECRVKFTENVRVVNAASSELDDEYDDPDKTELDDSSSSEETGF